jgi:hypothetical protein
MPWFDNATQATGVLAYSLASASGALAAHSLGRTDARCRAWWWIAGLFACLTVDVALDLRLLLRGAVDQWMVAAGTYGQRHALQYLLLGLGLAAGVAALALAWPMARQRGPGWAWAGAGALLAGGVEGLELVSLHRVDAWLYALAGPVMPIAALWALASGCVVWGTWVQTRRG